MKLKLTQTCHSEPQAKNPLLLLPLHFFLSFPSGICCLPHPKFVILTLREADLLCSPL
jgi:hypothetical protein